MTFTVEHFHQLTQLLHERPEWRAEMRRLLLTEEILNLPHALSELAVAQQRTEDGLQRLEAQVEELAVAQQRTEARVEELAVAQQRTEERLNRIEAVLHTIKDDLAYLKGRNLEQLHRERPHQYFRGIISKARTLTIDELRHLTETAVEKTQITENKADDIELADAVVRGTEQQTGARIYLVVESSWGVGKNDVERSARRAAFLADTGIRTRPVAAGRWATPEAHDAAEKLDVWLVVNGHALAPSEEESP